MRRWISLALLVAVLAAASLGWRALAVNMRAPSAAAQPVRVVVEPGATLRAVLRRLQQRGGLRHADWVQLYLRITGERPRLQAGTYEIAAYSTPAAILAQFDSGRVLLEQITVVEGWTFVQMRHALDSDTQLAHELRGLTDEQLMRTLGHPGEYPEGRFFPDTYRFAAGTSDRKVMQMAYERMSRELATAWTGRAPGLPLDSPQQALVLASIVEKETGRADERPKIAAVFINRLRRGMRLQSDPTVIYGMGARYDGDIRSRDLVTDTPYNSYTRAGLPPTPIALPGAASLQAVMHPAATDALYFVATGEGDGGHTFSVTLVEHDAAVRHYLTRLGVQPRAHAQPGARPAPP